MLQGVLHGVGVETEPRGLLADGTDISRVGVADGYHGMASV